MNQPQRAASCRTALIPNLPLLAECVLCLTAASMRVRLVPFKRITRAITGRRLRRSRSQMVDVVRLRWAVKAAARRLPLRTKCIEMALCLQEMLRRRGVASTLHYGVRQAAGEDLAAHVWLTISGECVLGCEAAPRYACVATYAFQGEA